MKQFKLQKTKKHFANEDDEFSADEEEEKGVDVYRAIPKKYGEDDLPVFYEGKNKSNWQFDPNLIDKVKKLEEDIRSNADSDDKTRDGDDHEGHPENDRYDPFKYTHFTSFRKFKLIEEDYKLLTVEDPEITTDVKNENFFQHSKLLTEAIEVVPMS